MDVQKHELIFCYSKIIFFCTLYKIIEEELSTIVYVIVYSICNCVSFNHDDW